MAEPGTSPDDSAAAVVDGLERAMDAAVFRARTIAEREVGELRVVLALLVLVVIVQQQE